MATTSDLIRLLIVEDQKLTRMGIVEAFRETPDIRVVADCGTSKHALEIVASEAIDVVLFDLNLHGVYEWQTIEQIKEIRPNVKVIIISAEAEQLIAAQSFRLTSSYLDKHTPPKELANAVRDAYHGKIVGRAEKLRQALGYGDSRTQFSDPRIPRLTDLEIELLRLLQDGLDAQAIADILGIKKDAIYKRGTSICGKLDIKNWNDLRVWAVMVRPLDRLK